MNVVIVGAVAFVSVLVSGACLVVGALTRDRTPLPQLPVARVLPRP